MKDTLEDTVDELVSVGTTVRFGITLCVGVCVPLLRGVFEKEVPTVRVATAELVRVILEDDVPLGVLVGTAERVWVRVAVFDTVFVTGIVFVVDEDRDDIGDRESVWTAVAVLVADLVRVCKGVFVPV